jgi:DHA2 family multidrug resistance protein
VGTFVDDPPYLPRGIRRVDWLGIALLTIGLTGMQIVLERGQEHNWFHSSWITMATIVTVLALGCLVWRELVTTDPIVNFRVLRNIPLSVGASMGLLFGIAFFGTTFSLPQFTQRLLHYPAYQAGLVLLPRAIMLFLTMPLVGRLYNIVEPRLIIAVGVGLTYLAFYQLSHLSLNVSFWNLVPIMVLMGLGMPCMFVTLSTLSLNSVKREEMTASTSLYTLARRVGGNLGYALVATLLQRFSIIHEAHLSTHISRLNDTYPGYHAALAARLAQQTGDPVAAQTKALALVDNLVHRQASMLAYNNLAWIFGLMFLCTLPLLYLFPRRKF